MKSKKWKLKSENLKVAYSVAKNVGQARPLPVVVLSEGHMAEIEGSQMTVVRKK